MVVESTRPESPTSVDLQGHTHGNEILDGETHGGQIHSNQMHSAQIHETTTARPTASYEVHSELWVL